MSLRIPDELLEGFIEISKLPIEKIQEISSVVSKTRIGVGLKEFSFYLENELKDIDVSVLARTIYSFGTILKNVDEPLDDTVSMLDFSFNKSYSEDYNQEEFVSKLRMLFESCYNIMLSFKAAELLTENDIIYRDARVFSDIRLLFKDKVVESNKNRNGVIIHRLKLECESNDGNEESFFIALDKGDLVKLKEVINRAIEKENQILSDFSNINFIEMTQ